jgi:hypothetical protein
MPRRILVLLAFLAIPSFALARDSAKGWCEEGNRSVITSGLASTTKVQQSHPQCIITVYIHGGGLASIYRDNNSTVLGNPFVAQTDGQWQWYADNGRYDVTMSSAGFGQTITYSDILLCDPFETGSTCNNGGTSQAHNLLSTTHLDTIPASPPVRGDLITAQNLTSPTSVTPAWARLPIGTTGQLLLSDGIDALWGNLVAGSGITITNSSSSTLTIAFSGSTATGSCIPTGGNVSSSAFCGGPVPTLGPLGVPYIQGNTGGNYSLPARPFTVNVPYLSPVTVGNQLVVMVACDTFPVLDCQVDGSVTDDLGNVFTKVAHGGASYLGIDIFVAPVVTGGVDTVHAVFGAGGSAVTGDGVIIGEYQNIGAFDTTANNAGTNGLTTVSITPNFNGEILIGLITGISSNPAGTVNLASLSNWNQNPLGGEATAGTAPATALGATFPVNSYASAASVAYTMSFTGTNISGLGGFAGGVIFAFRPTTFPFPTSGPPLYRALSPYDLPFQLGLLVATGTSTLGTALVSSGACVAAVTTTAPGTTSADNIMADFNSDPTATTGYLPGAMLTIVKYPTTDAVNFKVCNNTASNITPAAVTLNWKVLRKIR